MYICACTWSCEACIEVRLALRCVSSEVVSRSPQGSNAAASPRGRLALAPGQQGRSISARSPRFLNAVAPLVMPRCSSRTFLATGLPGCHAASRFNDHVRHLGVGWTCRSVPHPVGTLSHMPTPCKFQWHASCWAGVCAHSLPKSHPHCPVHHAAALCWPFFYTLPAPHPLIL